MSHVRKVRWHQGLAIIGVLLALAVLALVTIQPAGAQNTPPPRQMDYPENSDRMVARVHATDPEGKGLNWSTSGADGEVLVLGEAGEGTDQFDISDTGVLTFKTPPDFEQPVDAGTNNIYNVKVTATDTDGVASAAQDFIITVTNVEEKGKVTLSGLQPRVGVELTATLSDEDRVAGVVEWQWASSSRMSGSYSNIAGATNVTYTPVADDVGRYLRATASYNDRESATNKKSAYKSSHYPVQAELEVGVANRLPSFDQDDTLADVNTLFDLDLSDSTVQLEVAENAPVGMNVGDPIAANDPDEDDRLTYALSGADDAAFDIDRATGQIMVKRKLNFEGTAGATSADNCVALNACAVTVTATDSSGTPDTPVTIAVAIAVTAVNEPPTITRGNKAVSINENTDPPIIDADGDGADDTYAADDPDAGATLTWSVSGTDASSFEFDAGTLGQLQFKDSPDYEKPADANKNNVYEITLEVSDGVNSATLDVKVTVNNEQESPGTITFSHLQPREARSFTATLMDPDGGITAAKWQWSISTGAATTPSGDISGATSRTYTPKAGDVGGTLTATVTYTDGESSGQTATAPSANPVQAAGANRAPAFGEALYERTVAENEAADANVGDVITATDPDNDPAATPPGTAGTDVLQYSLTGTDSKHFEIGNDGQIATVASLDFEKPLDSNRDSVYSFSLAATDSSGRTGTTRVAISVTNVGETPAAAAATRSVAENAPIGTKLGDPISLDTSGDSTSLTYALTGTEDDAKFNINRTTGQITVKRSLNFEGTAGEGDQCDDDSCDVTVTVTGAIPGEADETTTIDVTISVTNVNEAPEYPETATRYVVENTASDRTLGNPVRLNTDGDTAATGGDTDAVVATDPDAGDRLAYTLGGPDAMYFVIYKATGQIITKELLDYEGLPSSDKSYDVTVTATDRMGLSDSINLTIEVVDVNEPPRIIQLAIAGESSVDYPEKGTSVVGTYTAESENADRASWALEGTDAADFSLSRNSGASTMLRFRSSPNFEAPADADTDNTYMVTVKAMIGADLMVTQAVTVTVTDVEELGMLQGMENISYEERGIDVVATYSTTGPATATWSLDGADAGDFTITSGALQFRSSPNYEAAADANGDNVYMVTVKADAGGEMGMKAVTVTVTNVDEEGAVTLSSARPQAGESITATLSDPDGGVTATTWQWSKAMTMNGSFTDISGADSDSYTPVDADDGYYLKAKAMYDDAEGSGKMAMVTTNMAVTTNRAPSFATAATSRDIAENSAVETFIGVPVAANDPDNDALTYTLSGPDSAAFSIHNTGQIAIGADTMLDYETKTTYMVTVTATDPDGEAASIEVTINVTNVGLDNRYDTSDNGAIEKLEVIAAIDDYFADPAAATRAEVEELIGLYFG